MNEPIKLVLSHNDVRHIINSFSLYFDYILSEKSHASDRLVSDVLFLYSKLILSYVTSSKEVQENDAN